MHRHMFGPQATRGRLERAPPTRPGTRDSPQCFDLEAAQVWVGAGKMGMGRGSYT